MLMSGQVLDNCTACLRAFSAAMRMSAALLRSASDIISASFLLLNEARHPEVAAKSSPRRMQLGRCDRHPSRLAGARASGDGSKVATLAGVVRARLLTHRA